MKKVISRDGTSIAYDQYGKGQPVILVSGAFQHRQIDPGTAQLGALLGQHFTVLHYDRRGRGDSSDTLPYAVEREIEDLDALINAVGGQAYVFGHSSGAALALEAAGYGLKINKLVLYEPPFMTSNGNNGSRLQVDHVAQLSRMVSSGRRGEAVEYFMTRVVGLPPENVKPVRSSPVWPSLEAVAPTLVYDLTILGDSSVPLELAANVRIPVLVMDGAASFPFMHASAQALAGALPAGHIRTLPGQTHEVNPEVLAPLLVEFFAQED
jgi:pimeloyl-ACP methyl ester carboxylesterase